MAAVQGSQPKTVSKGCFKCGKTGHWSRDCNAPPSEWIARPPSQPGQGDTSAQTQPGASAEQPAQLHIPLTTGKRKRQKPKLTVEHLKAERHGIAEVFHTFPQLFREQFRGKGHEAGDLKRLLELYVGWQQRILPFSTFDAFLEALEKLGSSYVLKMELRELRSGVLKVMEVPTEENASWFGMGQNASASPGKHECTAVATGQTCTDDGMEMPDWGDEDLLAMQAEPMVPCGPSNDAKQHNTELAGDKQLELDDDELLELVGDMPEHTSAAQQHPSAIHLPSVNQQELDGIDDDELQELAEADMEYGHQQPVQARQEQTQHIRHKEPTAEKESAQQGGLSHSINSAGNAKLHDDDVMLDDDELIELACASLSEEAHNAHEQGEDRHVHLAAGAPLTDTLDDDELLALATTQLDGA